MKYITIPRPLEFSYVPLVKPILPPLAIAGIAAGAGSFLGGIASGLFGSHSQRKTNAANLQIARETNKSNERIQDKQNAFNLKMWNLQNAYNTPLAQRQRYEDAGINPYFAMSNISSGDAESLLSANSSPMQAAQMQPVNYDFIGNSVNIAAQTFATAMQGQQAAEAAHAQQIANAYQPSILASQLRLINANLENTFGDTRLKHLQYKVQSAAYQDTLDTIHQQRIGAELDNNLKQLQQTSLAVQIDIQKFTRDKINPMQLQTMAAQVDQLTASAFAARKQGELTQKQIDHYSEQLAIQWLQANASWLNAKASMQNANTNSRLADSTIAVNEAQVNSINATTGKTKAETWFTRQQIRHAQQMFKGRLNILNNNAAMSGSDAVFRPFNNFTHLVPIGSLPSINSLSSY